MPPRTRGPARRYCKTAKFSQTTPPPVVRLAEQLDVAPCARPTHPVAPLLGRVVVKRFQTFPIDPVGRRSQGPRFSSGSALRPSHDGIRRMRWNDLSYVVAVRSTARTSDRTDSPQPSSLRGTSLHRSVELEFSPRLFRPDQSSGCGVVFAQRNSVPSAHMRCMITAILRATATTARFSPRCRAIFMPQALSHDHLMVRVNMT